MSKVKLGEQISAVRSAIKITYGSEKPPRLDRERVYLENCLEADLTTLSWLQPNEAQIRVALYRDKEKPL